MSSTFLSNLSGPEIGQVHHLAVTNDNVIVPLNIYKSYIVNTLFTIGVFIGRQILHICLMMYTYTMVATINIVTAIWQYCVANGCSQMQMDMIICSLGLIIAHHLYKMVDRLIVAIEKYIHFLENEHIRKDALILELHERVIKLELNIVD